MKDFLDFTEYNWCFPKIRKMYGFARLIIKILLMGALIVFIQGSIFAPFKYSSFQPDPLCNYT